MHEWALAEAIASTAIRVSKKEKLKKVLQIKIRVGELQQVDTEILEFAFQQISLSHGDVLSGASLLFETEGGAFKCRNCSLQWDYKKASQVLAEDTAESIHFIPELAHVFIRCPDCSSPDFEVIKGRNLWVGSVTGEQYE